MDVSNNNQGLINNVKIATNINKKLDKLMVDNKNEVNKYRNELAKYRLKSDTLEKYIVSIITERNDANDEMRIYRERIEQYHNENIELMKQRDKFVDLWLNRNLNENLDEIHSPLQRLETTLDNVMKNF